MKGVFENIIEQVYASQDLEHCKQIVVDAVSASRINAHDKMKILHTTREQETLAKLQQYITNSYFQYNGMKVI